jgi:hypothetical protein
MCAVLVGLPDVTVIGVGEWPGWVRVVIEVPNDRPACGCAGVVHRHGFARSSLWICPCLVDLPDWCDASNAGDARTVATAGATRTRRAGKRRSRARSTLP